ncbi:MAG: DNA-binding protein [Chloroflexota bacterium]|nr:DNA-binding protein [Chloroflexota bacterium]
MVTQVRPDQAIQDDDVALSEVTVTLTLSADQWRRIEEMAAGYGVSTHDLLRIGLDDFLDGPDETFQQTTDHILQKYAELYRRLA